MKTEAEEFRDKNIKAFEYTGTQYMLYDDVIKLCKLCRKEERDSFYRKNKDSTWIRLQNKEQLDTFKKWVEDYYKKLQEGGRR